MSYPFEGHLVHANVKGELAVVAVMFKESGSANALVDSLWKEMPREANERKALAQAINVHALLPKTRTYYRFNGSLTTPPCSEGVRWLVMKNAVPVSHTQIEAFQQVMKYPNNRPLQAVNAREVLK